MPLLYIKQSYFIGTRSAVKVSLDFGYVWGKIPPGKRLKWHSEHLDFEIFRGSMPPDTPRSSRLWRFRNCLGYQKSLATALTL